jgi:cytidylate kinase
VIITIDGPAGSGKSSTARAAARRLGFRHLDSGAFYRALTWAALDAGIPPERWPSLTEQEIEALAVSGVSVDGGYTILVGTRDVSELIRSPEVNNHVSRIAALPTLRNWLLGQLRAAGADGDLVTDGRDMGTVVFPAADVKFFLVADPAIRATRRLQEQGQQPGADAIAREIERLAERDRLDSERETAPLRRPDDAIVIDTTNLSFDAQVDEIVRRARERRP